MRKYVIAGLLVASFVTPAFAGTFYVAQSASTKKCSVTKTKPDGTKMTPMGSDTYKTKVEAMKAMKGMSDCKA